MPMAAKYNLRKSAEIQSDVNEVQFYNCLAASGML